MFTIHTCHWPDYLTDSVQACNSDLASTRLRSASSTDYLLHLQKRNFETAFSVAGLILRNSLAAAAVHEGDSLYSFKHKAQTHLFTLCFNVLHNPFYKLILHTFIMHSQSGVE